MIVRKSERFLEPLEHFGNTEMSDKSAQCDIFLKRLRTIPPLPNRVGVVSKKKFFFENQKIFVITSQNLLSDRKKLSGVRRTVRLL